MKRFVIVGEFREFLGFLAKHLRWRLARAFWRFEKMKDVLVDTLYRRRGKYARPFVHTGMMGMLFSMVTVGPMVLSGEVFSSDLAEGRLPTAQVLGVSAEDYTNTVGTLQGDEVKRYRGGEVVEYQVQEGDTLSGVADKFEISVDTILWANDLSEGATIKPGQTLDILPVTGVVHKVKKGETVYTIAKKYGLEGDSGAQAIVDYPFNEFVDDEEFTLAVGQSLVIPDGVLPDVTPVAPRPTYASRLTPDAGAVSATGSFVWPASGGISQGFRFYHKGIDIANRAGGAVVAADAGTVVVAGWPDNSGYGNRIVVDHGNGFVTLYAHLSRIRVQVGQRVNRGDVIGDMGSTGRSTGIHLHFEVRRGGGFDDPLSHLR